jgi:LytS/YehU family sensor histidine kinase
MLEGGVVRINATRGATSLVVSVDNPCDADRPSGRGTGLGLRNVRERLESEYGPDARLRTEEADGRFVARIDVPLEP